MHFVINLFHFPKSYPQKFIFIPTDFKYREYKKNPISKIEWEHCFENTLIETGNLGINLFCDGQCG